MSLFRYTWFF